MATGILGQSSLTASTNTTVYTVPAGKTATFNISVCNKSSNLAAVSLALSASSTPTSSEYIEYNTVLPVNGVLERTGIVANATKLIVANSSVSGVTINIYGYEE